MSESSSNKPFMDGVSSVDPPSEQKTVENQSEPDAKSHSYRFSVSPAEAPPVASTPQKITVRSKPARIPLYAIRRIFFAFAAAFALAVPFVSINGNGLLRMSFLHSRLEFLGMSFDTNQLYVIPFMIQMFAGLVLLVTAVGGRVWCGWGCPQTMFRFVYRDVIQSFILKLRDPKNKNKPLRLDTLGKKTRFVLGIVMYACIAVLGTANLLWYFISPTDFYTIVLANPEQYPFVMSFWAGMSLFFIIDITFVAENFCKYICPYARIQSVFFDKETALVVYDKDRGNNNDGSRGMKNFAGQRDKSGDCTDCLACVKVCPTGIDIRDGLQLGCIECLECVDACHPVMERKHKQNLVNWTTMRAIEGRKPRIIRPRTVFYAGLIVIAFSILMFLSFSHSVVNVNINRTSELYAINTAKNEVENYYVLLISNSTSETIRVDFDVSAPFTVELKRGGDSFELYPNEKIKKILIIASPIDPEVSADAQTKPDDITIRLVDSTAPDNVISEKTAVFFRP